MQRHVAHHDLNINICFPYKGDETQRVMNINSYSPRPRRTLAQSPTYETESASKTSFNRLSSHISI